MYRNVNCLKVMLVYPEFKGVTLSEFKSNFSL